MPGLVRATLVETEGESPEAAALGRSGARPTPLGGWKRYSA